MTPGRSDLCNTYKVRNGRKLTDARNEVKGIGEMFDSLERVGGEVIARRGECVDLQLLQILFVVLEFQQKCILQPSEPCLAIAGGYLRPIWKQ